MQKRTILLVGVLIAVIISIQTGCRFGGTSPSGPEVGEVSGPQTIPAAAEMVPALRFKFVFPPAQAQAPAPAQAPYGKAAPLPVILAAGNATMTPTVTAKLILVNIGNATQPVTTLSKTVPVASDGQAVVEFTSIPALTCVGDIHIENGHLSGYSDFHGATDLMAGVQNVIEAAPQGSKLKADIIATVIKQIVGSPDLFSKALTGLAGRLGSATIGLNLDSVTIYDDVAALFLFFGVPKVETGSMVAVADRSVGPTGGTITVASLGSPINGLEISVPAGAFGENVNFSISYSPIASHTFGASFNPQTPLITTDNGGKSASDPVRVKVPVSVSNDEFAMAFYFNSSTGRLEGAPLLSGDNQTITIADFNFQKSSISPSIRLQTTGLNTPGGFIVSKILKSQLDGEFDTSFQPGVDDWQFVNRGSYVTPGGHCYGQTISSIWYFTEMKMQTGKGLFGFSDNNAPWTPDHWTTPKIWSDDSRGYKFVALVQNAFPADSQLRKMATISSADDSSKTFNAFKYAIKLTGMPQYVAVWDPGFLKPDVGHALVVYKATNDGLYVSDPNHPGQKDRMIRFENGKFQTYYSGNDSLATHGFLDWYNNYKFTRFEFCSTGAFIPWNDIRDLWKKVEYGTIGDVQFPKPAITAKNDLGVFVPISDNFRTTQSAIEIQCSVPGDNTAGFYILNENSNPATTDFPMNYGLTTYPLAVGKNRLGVVVWATPPGGSRQYWVDFQWVTVQRDGGTGPAVQITGVTPDIVAGVATPQPTTLTIDGSGFQSGCQVTLAEPTFAVNVTKAATFISATQVQVSAAFGTDQTTWTAQVVNPDSSKSDPFSFNVISPGGKIVTTDGVSVAAGYRAPIGGPSGADLKLLTVGTFQATRYPKIRFNDNGNLSSETNEWYVAVGFNTDKWLNGGWNSDSVGAYSTSGAFHPGEDWNLTSGSDSELSPAQPVSAIADGVVLYNGPTPAYGNVVVLVHQTSGGDFVTSFYAHLAAPLPGLPVGARIFKGARIGDVGNSGPTGTPAHLHFEIRRQSLVRIDQRTKAIVLAYPVTMWPATVTPSDHGAKFIGDNYYNPSEFLGGAKLPTAVPLAPGNVKATAGYGRNYISWNPVPGIASYNVYFSNVTGVTKAAGNLLSGKTSPFDHPNLTAGSTYYYVVTAYNDYGESVESVEVSAAPGARPSNAFGLGQTVTGLNQNAQVILTRVPTDFQTSVLFTDDNTGEDVVFAKSAVLSYPNFRRLVLGTSGSIVRSIRSFDTLMFTTLPPAGARIEVFDPDQPLVIASATVSGGSLQPLALGKTVTGSNQNMQVIISEVPSGFDTTASLVDKRTREEVTLSKSAAMSFPNFNRLVLATTDATVRTLEDFDSLLLTTTPPAGARVELRDPDKGLTIAMVTIPGGSQSVISLGTTVTGANQNVQIVITNVLSSFLTSTGLVDDRTGEAVAMSQSAALSFPNLQQLTLGVTNMTLRSIRSFDTLAFSTPVPSGAQIKVFDPEKGLALARVTVP